MPQLSELPFSYMAELALGLSGCVIGILTVLKNREAQLLILKLQKQQSLEQQRGAAKQSPEPLVEALRQQAQRAEQWAADLHGQLEALRQKAQIGCYAVAELNDMKSKVMALEVERNALLREQESLQQEVAKVSQINRSALPAMKAKLGTIHKMVEVVRDLTSCQVEAAVGDVGDSAGLGRAVESDVAKRLSASSKIQVEVPGALANELATMSSDRRRVEGEQQVGMLQTSFSSWWLLTMAGRIGRRLRNEVAEVQTEIQRRSPYVACREISHDCLAASAPSTAASMLRRSPMILASRGVIQSRSVAESFAQQAAVAVKSRGSPLFNDVSQRWRNSSATIVQGTGTPLQTPPVSPVVKTREASVLDDVSLRWRSSSATMKQGASTPVQTLQGASTPLQASSVVVPWICLKSPPTTHRIVEMGSSLRVMNLSCGTPPVLSRHTLSMGASPRMVLTPQTPSSGMPVGLWIPAGSGGGKQSPTLGFRSVLVPPSRNVNTYSEGNISRC